jgi:hypothetical protein
VSDTFAAKITTETDFPYILPYLRALTYGTSIPTDGSVVIKGVKCELEFNAHDEDVYADLDVRLAWDVNAASLSASSLHTGVVFDGTTRIYGGPEEMWGENSLTLTPTIVNSSNFGWVFKCVRASGTVSQIIGIDSMKITVYYGAEDAGGGGLASSQYRMLLLGL